MKKLPLIVAVALFGLSTIVSTAAAQPRQPLKRVLFLTMSQGFQHDPINRTRPDASGGLSLFENILTSFGKWNNFEVTCTKDAAVFNDPATFDKYDVFAFYVTGDLTKNSAADGGKGMTPEAKVALLKAIENGKGVLGFHSTPDVFHIPGAARPAIRPIDFDPKVTDPFVAMIGGEFLTHQSQQKATMKMVSPTFPGLEGLKSFDLFDEWYVNNNTAPDLHVILVQDTGSMGRNGTRDNAYNRAPYPATWARMQGKGRVFYTSMGHRQDVVANPIFLQVTLAGLNWTSGRTQFDPKPNMEEVCPPSAPVPPAAK